MNLEIIIYILLFIIAFLSSYILKQWFINLNIKWDKEDKELRNEFEEYVKLEVRKHLEQCKRKGY